MTSDRWLSPFKNTQAPWPTPEAIARQSPPHTQTEVHARLTAATQGALGLAQSNESPGVKASRLESLFALIEVLQHHPENHDPNGWVRLLREVTFMDAGQLDRMFTCIPWAAETSGRSILEKGTNASLWRYHAGLLPGVLARSPVAVGHQGLIYALALQQTPAALRIAATLAGPVDVEAGWAIRLDQVKWEFHKGQDLSAEHQAFLRIRFMAGCKEALEASENSSWAQTLLAQLCEPYQKEMETDWYESRYRARDRTHVLDQRPSVVRTHRPRA